MIRMPRAHLSRRSRLVAIAAAATFLVAGGAVSAGAYWTSSATISTSVAPAAVSLTVANVSSLGTEWKFAGAATNSPVIKKELTITNTGAAPLSYTLAIANTTSTLAAATKLWLWTETGCTTLPGTAGTLAAPPALPSGAATAAAGVAVKLCAATQLNSTVAAAQGQSNTASFTVTGRVGTNWTATNATSASTQAVQTVFRIKAPTAPICNDTLLGLFGLRFSWTAPTGTPAASGYTLTGNGTQTALGTVTTPYADLSKTGGLGTISVHGATVVSVVATETTYGTTSTPIQITIRDTGASIGCAP